MNESGMQMVGDRLSAHVELKYRQMAELSTTLVLVLVHACMQ